MATQNNQSPAYHGVKNAKYVMRKDDGTSGTTIADMQYIKSISFDPTVEQQPVYANDQKILTLVTDNGYTGAIGTTAQDRAFEGALGYTMPIAGALADVSINSFKRFDYYYEYQEKTKSGQSFTVKVWALNLEAAKASKNHQSDTNTSTLGEYSYSITVYGDKIKSSDGTSTYKDANGNEVVATRLISVPGDNGYEAFSDTVPIPQMPTPSAP